MSPYYIGEVTDSDGNDCTVYDILTEASNKDEVIDIIKTWVEEYFPDDEDDGGYGTFHPCNCLCKHNISPYECTAGCGTHWECEHGGTLISEPEQIEGPFASYEEARKACQVYHHFVELLGN